MSRTYYTKKLIAATKNRKGRWLPKVNTTKAISRNRAYFLSILIFLVEGGGVFLKTFYMNQPMKAPKTYGRKLVRIRLM